MRKNKKNIFNLLTNLIFYGKLILMKKTLFLITLFVVSAFNNKNPIDFTKPWIASDFVHPPKYDFNESYYSIPRTYT